MAAVRLRLFVCGDGPRSRSARDTLRQLAQDVLDDDGYDLEVVDVLERPDLAEEHRVLVTPTLDRIEPSPTRRILGDLSDIDAVARGLGVERPRRTTA